MAPVGKCSFDVVVVVVVAPVPSLPPVRTMLESINLLVSSIEGKLTRYSEWP